MKLPFTLSFDPNYSDQYSTGYWYCYAEPGYDGSGTTPENAMAECLIAMSKALTRKDADAERTTS